MRVGVPAEAKVEFDYEREGQVLLPDLDLAVNRAAADALRAAGTTG